MAEVKERIEPIRITDNDTGKVYTLDFNRESVKFVEGQGFKIEDTFELPNVNIPKLFYFALRASHKSSVSLNQAEALLDKMGGLTDKIAIRLVDLYRQATESNNILQDSEDLEKNPHVTVEL